MATGNLSVETLHSSIAASMEASSHLSAFASRQRIYRYCLFAEGEMNYYYSCHHFDFGRNYHGLN